MKKIIRLTESDLARIVRKVIKEQNDQFWNQHTNNGTTESRLEKDFPSVPFIHPKNGLQLQQMVGQELYKWNIGFNISAIYRPKVKPTSDSRFKYFVTFYLTKNPGGTFDSVRKNVSVAGNANGYMFLSFNVFKYGGKWVSQAQKMQNVKYDQILYWGSPKDLKKSFNQPLGQLADNISANSMWIPQSLRDSANTELEKMGYPPFPKGNGVV